MIQRIQSIYLLLVILINAASVFFFPLWVNETGVATFSKDKPMVLAAVALTAMLALVALFLFKNRKLQFVLGRLNIVLNFVLIGFFVYWLLMLSGEMHISEKGIGIFTPIVSIVFLVLANKAIKKDEELVKSVDRLR